MRRVPGAKCVKGALPILVLVWAGILTLDTAPLQRFTSPFRPNLGKVWAVGRGGSRRLEEDGNDYLDSFVFRASRTTIYEIPNSFASAFHLLSTRDFVFASIRISSGQGRVKPSVGHLRVASMPIFDP